MSDLTDRADFCLNQANGDRLASEVKAAQDKTPRPTRYLGQQGDRCLVQQLGEGVTAAGVLQATGGIPVGGMVQKHGNSVDAMPRVKRVVEKVSTGGATGKIKILFSQFVDGMRVFYVGGDRTKPVEVFTMPAGTTFQSASLSNTGTGINKWVATIEWAVGIVRNVAIVTSSAAETFTNTSFYLKAKGHGFLATELLPVELTFPNVVNQMWMVDDERSPSSPNGGYVLSPFYAPATGVGNYLEVGLISTGRTITASGTVVSKGIALRQSGYLEALGDGYVDFSDVVAPNGDGGTVTRLENRDMDGATYLAPDLTKAYSYSYYRSRYSETDAVAGDFVDGFLIQNLDRELWETVIVDKQSSQAIALQRLDTNSINVSGVDSRNRGSSDGTNFDNANFITTVRKVYLINADEQIELTGDPLFDNDPAEIFSRITLMAFNFVNGILHNIDSAGFNKAENGKLEINSYALTAQPIAKTTKQVDYKKIADSTDSILVHSYSYHP